MSIKKMQPSGEVGRFQMVNLSPPPADFGRYVARQLGQIMKQPAKPTCADRLFGLMIFTGFSMLLCALPLGPIGAFQFYRDGNLDLYWSSIFGLTLTLTTAGVGCILLVSGVALKKRHHKMQTK